MGSGRGNWGVRHPNGELIHSRHSGGHIRTIDSKYARYAYRYSRKLARQIAREIGGEVVRLWNTDGSLCEVADAQD